MLVRFRRAESSDLVAVAELVNSAYRGEASRTGWTCEADLLSGQRTDPQSLRQQCATPGAQIVIAEDEVSEEMVGMFFYQPDPHAPLAQTAAGYVGMITVRPALQNQGLGKQLIAEAERIAVADHRPALTMWVIRQRQTLIDFYRRLGYLPTEETAPFPYGDDKAGIPLRDDLEFVILSKSLK